MKNTAKMIVITGASSGIGEALAYYYAEQGQSLALTGRNEARLKNVAKVCYEKGAFEVESKIIDVTDGKGMEVWLDKVDLMQPIDLVVANAGISGGTGGLDGKDLFVQTRKIFDVNITGVLNTIAPVYKKMVKRESGHIAIVSSMASFSAWSGAPAYSSSKAAIRFLGEGMAASCQKYNIGVSVICPGFVESRITDANDFPMPMKLSAEKAAKIIAKGLAGKKRVIAFPLITYMAVRMVAILPSSLISLLTQLLPVKKGL